MAGRTRNARNRERMLAVGLPAVLRDPCRYTTNRPRAVPAAMTRFSGRPACRGSAAPVVGHGLPNLVSPVWHRLGERSRWD